VFWWSPWTVFPGLALERLPGLTAVGQVSGEEGSFLPSEVYNPDVIAWDVSWETAIASRNLGLLPENSPPVLALVATGRQTEQANANGAHGLLNRNTSPDAMAAELTALSHGLHVTDPSLSWGLESTVPDFGSASPLTPRENDVLRLLAEGLPNKGVASRLEVSEHTVKFHVNSIMNKLNA